MNPETVPPIEDTAVELAALCSDRWRRANAAADDSEGLYRLDAVGRKVTASRQYAAAARRRAAALRMPPLASGHRDPIGARTDAPERGWNW